MEEEFKREELSSLDKLNFHTELQHKQVCNSKRKTLKCNTCGHECRSRCELTNHMRTHTGERPFECTVGGCGKTFKQPNTLTVHIKFKHSDERPFKCDFLSCLQTYKCLSDLKRHKTLHSDELPFPCTQPGCNFQAKRKDVLSVHTANVHSESKKIACSKCNFKAKNARSLTGHMVVHGGCSRIQCTIEGCDHTGKNKRALKWHMHRHGTPVPCPVSGCGRYAPSKEALKYHLKLHSNPSNRASKRPLWFKHNPTVDDQQSHCCVTTNEKLLKLQPEIQSDSSNSNWLVTYSQILATTTLLNSSKPKTLTSDLTKRSPSQSARLLISSKVTLTIARESP